MAVPPPQSPPHRSDDRTALRRRLRAARREFVGSLDPESHAVATAAIDARLSPLLIRAGATGGPIAGPIAGYVAHRSEADPLPFLIRAWQAGHDVALPHVPAQGEEGAMIFTRWSPATVLIPGLAGIPQPEMVEPIEPAIILAPLLGFDRAGGRLGQGGGFYDRWFARHPDAMRIGIAWSVQEVPALACAAWDVPLHAIVTETEWIVPS